MEDLLLRLIFWWLPEESLDYGFEWLLGLDVEPEDIDMTAESLGRS